MNNQPNDRALSPDSLSTAARYLILLAAFLGWLCAGIQMSITSLAMRPAAIDLLARAGDLDREQFNELNRRFQHKVEENSLSESEIDQLTAWRGAAAQWFAWYQCAFLFGAAAGGLVFGRLGDGIGRAKAMAASIVCYSVFSGLGYFADTPAQLLVLRFAACLGVGGMWPNGVALVSEASSTLSRPLAAGVIGTSANIGILLFAILAGHYEITADHWRWVMLVGAAPVLLGLFVLAAVPESPRWLATRDEQVATDQRATSTGEIFRSPFLSITLLGIVLATIPLIGGWGSSNWMVPWAGEAGETAHPPNPYLQAHVGQARALTGIVGSLFGGWIGSFFGRRRSYCLVSFAALFCAQYAFWFTVPTDGTFLYWVAALGFFSGIYFGWLPLFLPELFPTRLRSTGSGVSFNFGRILTAVTIFATGALQVFFAGDYAKIGRLTSLIYAFGIVVIWFAPDTTKRQLED